MRDLGASEDSIKKMEENMKLGLENFDVRETQYNTNGHVDVTFPFKRSEQSNNYYFSKFTAEHYKIKPLPEGHSYFIITPKGEGKNDVKKLDHPIDAIVQFKKREGNAELAMGEKVANRNTLAQMEEGKVNFVSNSFRGAFYAKPIDQTFFTEQGKGFTVQQARNLVQGRSVYRDDLVDQSGSIYKAWVSLDMNTGKTGLNFKLTMHRDPEYGFDLSKVLSEYNIKGINTPEEKEMLEIALKNGDRPTVLATSGSTSHELNLETAVRFKKINFFRPDGTPEKREQFQIKQGQDVHLDKEESKDKNLIQGQEITR